MRCGGTHGQDVKKVVALVADFSVFCVDEASPVNQKVSSKELGSNPSIKNQTTF